MPLRGAGAHRSASVMKDKRFVDEIDPARFLALQDEGRNEMIKLSKLVCSVLFIHGLRIKMLAEKHELGENRCFD